MAGALRACPKSNERDVEPFASIKRDDQTMFPITRRQALAASGGLLTSLLAPRRFAAAAAGGTLNIAYNVNLPSFDPNTGPSSVNPTLQSIYRSVFNNYIGQRPDLSFEPALLSAWGWNEDKTKVWMDVRNDVFWHDGSRLTPEDIVWSIQRNAKPDGGNPVSFIWAGIDNFKIDDKRITADVVNYDPVLFKWMAFLTGYVLPKAYFEKVGPQGFEAKPIGSDPYMVDAYEGNAYLRLKAHPKYWGGKPPFDTVVFKFVPDATTRVAEIESGASDLTLEVPYEEYDRLKGKAGLKGVCEPTCDLGLLFITNGGVMDDKNVRLAMCHAVDKQSIIKRLLRGYGIRGFKPKDYEMIQAIVGMWRNVGIDANIEVYEVAKHFELRMTHKLAPAAFYNWGNYIGDPTTSTGFAMWSKSPHSAWHSDDLDAKITPLWAEKDEARRIQGWKDADRYIAEQGYVLPLLQYAQPILYKSDLKVTPNVSGALQPATLISKA
jgi:peptide/nickel transport system substrate-binding protein